MLLSSAMPSTLSSSVSLAMQSIAVFLLLVFVPVTLTQNLQPDTTVPYCVVGWDDGPTGPTIPPIVNGVMSCPAGKAKFNIQDAYTFNLLVDLSPMYNLIFDKTDIRPSYIQYQVNTKVYSFQSLTANINYHPFFTKGVSFISSQTVCLQGFDHILSNREAYLQLYKWKQAFTSVNPLTWACNTVYTWTPSVTTELKSYFDFCKNMGNVSINPGFPTFYSDDKFAKCFRLFPIPTQSPPVTVDSVNYEAGNICRSAPAGPNSLATTPRMNWTVIVVAIVCFCFL